MTLLDLVRFASRRGFVLFEGALSPSFEALWKPIDRGEHHNVIFTFGKEGLSKSRNGRPTKPRSSLTRFDKALPAFRPARTASFAFLPQPFCLKLPLLPLGARSDRRAVVEMAPIRSEAQRQAPTPLSAEHCGSAHACAGLVRLLSSLIE